MSDTQAPDNPGTPDADDTSTAAPARGGSKGRTALSVAFGVLAMLGLVLSTIGVWARQTVLDGEKVADTVVAAIQQPEVNDALATYLTDQLFTLVDVESVVENTLPDALGGFSGAIVGGMRSAVHEGASRLIATEQAQTVVHDLVLRAHDALIKVLKGEGLVPGVSVNDGEVSINLLPLLSRVLLRVQDLGLFDNLTIPEFDANDDPAGQISELETITGRDLPDDFGQLTVYHSDTIAQAESTIQEAQRVIALARRALLAVIVLTLALLVGAAMSANRRRRAVIALALASIAVMVVTRVALERVLDRSPQLVVNPGARVAFNSTLDDLTSSLFRLTAAVIIIAALTAFFGFLTGPSASARRMRAASGTGGQGIVGVGQRHPDGTSIVLFGVAVAVLLLFGLSWLTLILTGLIAVLGVAVLVNSRRAAAPAAGDVAEE